MSNIYFYFFIGTTAEYIKLSPVIKDFKKRGIKYKIITSGQTKIQFNELDGYVNNVKPNIKLQEKAIKSSILHFITWYIKTFFYGLFKLRSEFKGKNKNNCYFIVHGDTLSALMGSVFAKIFRLKLVHIEAGLRSYNLLEPFPEEICKVVINRLSDINACPNDWSLNNLANLNSDKINTNQNTIIEPFWWAINEKKGLSYAKNFKKYYILIVHRQEHIYFNKEWTRNMINFVINNSNKDIKCLFVMHSLTSRFLKSENLDIDPVIKKNLIMIPRLPYPEFITLLNNAEYIATDGCTNEEEAYYIGLPLLSLRNLTERIEGRNENVLISKGDKSLITNFLRNYKKYRRNSVKFKTRPSKIIVDYLLNRYD